MAEAYEVLILQYFRNVKLNIAIRKLDWFDLNLVRNIPIMFFSKSEKSFYNGMTRRQSRPTPIWCHFEYKHLLWIYIF